MNIDLHDREVWALYKDGLTKGIFQVESNLGRSWSKKLAPENMEELAALMAILRPGCLKAVSEGKSMTQRFVDRKHNREPVTYIHESLEDILKPTYGVLVYQEQAMRIAVKLAGRRRAGYSRCRPAVGQRPALPGWCPATKAHSSAGGRWAGLLGHRRRHDFGVVRSDRTTLRRNAWRL